MTKADKEERETRQKAVELAISYFQGRTIANIDKMSEMLKTTYNDIYKFIANRYKIPD